MWHQTLTRWQGTPLPNRTKGTTAASRPASATDVRRDPGRDQEGNGDEPGDVRHVGLSAQDDVMSDPILRLAGRNRYEKKRVAKSPVPDA